jgi:HPt (histidine-containing phosphotransfer) domain-containing protein
VQTDNGTVLNLEELRNLTMNDRQLMSEILHALIEDASRHAGLLETAVRESDAVRSVRIARQASRVCGNVGAVAAADTFRQIERHAGQREFESCRSVLAAARGEIERLRGAASQFTA